MKKALFTFMGSGTSRGVPTLCCDCEVCQSKDPRDRHTRSSGLVTVGETRILIDCGPDLREQLLREHVTGLDAVCLTHPHCDHLDGLDDLQGLTVFSRQELPFYSSEENLRVVHERFGYVDQLKYLSDGSPRWSVPQLSYRAVTEPFDVMPVPGILGLALRRERSQGRPAEALPREGGDIRLQNRLPCIHLRLQQNPRRDIRAARGCD